MLIKMTGVKMPPKTIYIVYFHNLGYKIVDEVFAHKVDAEKYLRKCRDDEAMNRRYRDPAWTMQEHTLWDE